MKLGAFQQKGMVDCVWKNRVSVLLLVYFLVKNLYGPEMGVQI
jgi:hypothetical protein